MKRKILIFTFLFVAIASLLLFGGCNTSATKKKYGNVTVFYENEQVGKFFKSEFLDENGKTVKSIEYGKTVTFNLIPVLQSSLIRVFPCNAIVNDKEEYTFTYENGKYSTQIFVEAEHVNIYVNSGSNEVSFALKEHSSMFNVSYRGEDGNELQSLPIGESAYFVLKPNSAQSGLVKYFPSDVTIDDEKYSFTYSNGEYFTLITATSANVKLNVSSGCNEVSFALEEHSSMFNVSFCDENGKELQTLPIGQSAYLVIERTLNATSVTEKFDEAGANYIVEYFVGFVTVNNSTVNIYSDRENKNIFKAQITLTEYQNKIQLTTFANSYLVKKNNSSVSLENVYDIVIKDKDGNEVFYVPENEQVTISLVREKNGYSLMKYKIEITGKDETLEKDYSEYVGSYGNADITATSSGKGFVITVIVSTEQSSGARD